MIETDALCFPNNVVDFLCAALQNIDPDTKIVKRPIKDTDSSQTISVLPVAWSPVQESMEMLGRRNEPTLQRYSILVESFIADMDEARGIRKHSLLSALVRHTLYRSPGLHVGLPMLKVEFQNSSGPTMESVSRWGVVSQNYMNNRVPTTGKFLFLSSTELFVETEFK